MDKSIAVLPFVNMSADPENEYFSDGITEEIINALTTIRGLKVTARTSSFAFKHKLVDVRTIGYQLGVATILEGSVRRSGEKVRITAQLVRTDDGFHLWSKSFDRDLEDIFAIQDEISLLIAEQIRENFGHFDIQGHLVEEPTKNVEAYNLYLKGRFHQLKWNSDDFLRAIDYYEQSIQCDPSYAIPYYGAGLCYSIMSSWSFMDRDKGIQKAAEYLKSGSHLKENVLLGNFAIATHNLWGKWNFIEAYQYLNLAIDQNPSFTDALEGMAELYTAIGEFDKAMKYTEKALLLNPLSPNHFYTKGNIYYLNKQYAKAIDCMNTALRIEPDFSLAIQVKALCYILMNDAKKLETHLAQNLTVEYPQKLRLLFKLMNSKETSGINAVDYQQREQWGLQNDSGSLIDLDLYLQIYLGNEEKAIGFLEQSIQKRKGQLINFKHDPFLELLRKNERFQKLIDELIPSFVCGSTLPDGRIVETSKLNSEEVSRYLSALYNLFEEHKPYLNTSLSLSSLAEQLNIHPNKLSWLINEHCGKNFNEFVNSYRLAAFKKKAHDPAYKHLTILGLAYESGFNSKTVFNAFFKKTTGMTPKSWIKSQRH